MKDRSAITPVAPQAKKERPRRRLYQPSVYRYHCVGDLQASSDDVGSRGVCRGIETRMQHVRDLYPSTREEAINHFCQETSYPPVQDSDDPHPQETLNSLLNNYQAIIYDDGDLGATGRQSSRNEKSDEMWQDWNSFGYTSVDFLVLKDIKTKQEKVAGVAPECRQGLATRGIGTNDGSEKSFSFRILWLEIMLRESSKPEDQHHEAIAQSDHDSEGNASPFSERFLDASREVGMHMKQNATLLKEAVSDDFPGRTIGAGKRIVSEMGKNMDRTSAFLESLYKTWRDDSDD